LFATGDFVRTPAATVEHHTRLPGYARGKVGRIERVLGVHVFADAHAQGLGEQPQWLYTVAFEARELWGQDAREGQSVSIDAWEAYLERLA
jgi:nitrile hydratase